MFAAAKRNMRQGPVSMSQNLEPPRGKLDFLKDNRGPKVRVDDLNSIRNSKDCSFDAGQFQGISTVKHTEQQNYGSPEESMPTLGNPYKHNDGSQESVTSSLAQLKHSQGENQSTFAVDTGSQQQQSKLIDVIFQQTKDLAEQKQLI